MTTRTLTSVVAGTLLCLALTSAAAARDCRDETPLPAGVRLIAPVAGVPLAAARVAGVWSGPWLGPDGDATACATLVVEEILPSGHARIVYSVGAWHVGDRGRLRCHHVYRDGDDVELRPDDRSYVQKYRRLPAP